MMLSRVPFQVKADSRELLGAGPVRYSPTKQQDLRVHVGHAGPRADGRKFGGRPQFSGAADGQGKG